VSVGARASCWHDFGIFGGVLPDWAQGLENLSSVAAYLEGEWSSPEADAQGCAWVAFGLRQFVRGSFEFFGIYRLRRSSSIFDDFVGFSLDSVESFSKLRVDLIELPPNIITVGFEKIGWDSSATFIGVGLNSGLFKALISVSLLSLVMA